MGAIIIQSVFKTFKRLVFNSKIEKLDLIRDVLRVRNKSLDEMLHPHPFVAFYNLLKKHTKLNKVIIVAMYKFEILCVTD
jgi:hypothetical protein